LASRFAKLVARTAARRGNSAPSSCWLRTANYKPQATSAASGGAERLKFQGRTQAQDSFVYMRPEPSRNFKPQPSSANESKDER
jgi:hypothetical protein